VTARRRQHVALVALLLTALGAVLVWHGRRADAVAPRAHGATVERYRLSSRLLGRSLSEAAVVPAGGPRPLLVLLHGRVGDSDATTGPAGPDQVLSSALVQAVSHLGARAPVVVLLNGSGHSYFHDRRDGRWASMLLDEAIPDAARRFHTTPGRVAIGGVSMGGYGALHVAALRPNAFCAVGGHSAAIWEQAGESAPGAFDDAEDFARNDVFAAARAGRFDHLRVWLDGGSDDPFRAADADLASLLRSRGVQVTHAVWPGGHDSAYWNAHMPAYLRFYAEALARCRGPRAAA
jgi:S-formylglutathione hydrolase FrmB